MAATHVVITIGLSEVPILVAAFRLCRLYQQANGSLPSFSAICLQDTLDEAERVRHLLVLKLRAESLLPPDVAFRWTAYVVPHSSPAAIRQAVNNLMKLQGPGCHFHFHYTGGSRALSVHAMEAIVTSVDANGERYSYEVSYLSSGENVLTWGNGVPPHLKDERPSWTLGIADLAALNGFTPSFYSAYLRQRFEVSEPDHLLVASGSAMLPVLLVPENRRVYADWLLKVWDVCWKGGSGPKGWVRWPQPPPRDRWPQQDIPWVMLSPETVWRDISSNLTRRFGGDPVWIAREGGWSLRITNLDEEGLSSLNQFLHYQCLELFAYHCLGTALADLGYCSWAVYHSVHLTRQDPRRSQRDFEVDVLAVLGYQMLAVSCSLSADQPALKRKAFEVLHRAKQIGGAGARTILICALSPNAADGLMRDVEEDTGPRERNLEIWGVDSLGGLTERFKGYLQDKLRVSVRS